MTDPNTPPMGLMERLLRAKPTNKLLLGFDIAGMDESTGKFYLRISGLGSSGRIPFNTFSDLEAHLLSILEGQK